MTSTWEWAWASDTKAEDELALSLKSKPIHIVFADAVLFGLGAPGIHSVTPKLWIGGDRDLKSFDSRVR